MPAPDWLRVSELICRVVLDEHVEALGVWELGAGKRTDLTLTHQLLYLFVAIT